MHQKDFGSSIYEIIDDDLELVADIDKSNLENPEFDLIEWYIKHIELTCNFYKDYLRRQRNRYNPGRYNERELYTGKTNRLRGYTASTKKKEVVLEQIQGVLERCSPFPGDEQVRRPADSAYYWSNESRFVMDIIDLSDHQLVYIYDRFQGFDAFLSWEIASWNKFSIGKWHAERCALQNEEETPTDVAHEWILTRRWDDTIIGENDDVFMDDEPYTDGYDPGDDSDDNGAVIPLNGVQVDRNKYESIQRNASRIKGAAERLLPKPVVIKFTVDGRPARALVDSGSLGDFMSATLVDQLKLKRTNFEKPLGLQLAVQGSRSKINSFVNVNYSYQDIDDSRRFDVANLNDYDVILGTPWIWQHKVCVGLNPPRIMIGSDTPIPIVAGPDTKYLLGAAALTVDDNLSSVRKDLMDYADAICRNVEDTELPPFRAINHSIPLIDESKIYPWRPSRCPEVFRTQWNEKRDAYIKSGRWKITMARNTCPMLLIPKPHKPKDAQELCTVFDLRERNKNTVRLTSPLPDIDGVLRRVAAKDFRSVLDLTAAYEQIRIIPEHVERSAMSTPDGNMVSLVLQMGDCNAPATYQSLMNYVFSPYIGRFLDVYLDDVIVYSDSLEEHIKHCKLVIDVLRSEKLYLSKKKLRFLPSELKPLGRIIDSDGIKMDPEKVDDVLAWKSPTNRDLLRGFIGSVGYLADDIPNIRIPLRILSAITGDNVPFRWTHTEHRAFEEAKSLVHTARDHSRRPISYGPEAKPVWMVTDGCLTGIAGVVSQGDTWKNAQVAAFYSVKLNSAQRNYPVHEIEMLAGVETMLRHRDVLQGVHFTWITDHKGLIHLLNQKNISGRQARWLEKISSFVFKVEYAAGNDNLLADALSRIYSNDSPGTVRARSEFTAFDVMDEDPVEIQGEMTLLAGMEAVVATHKPPRSKKVLGAETGRPETSKEFAQRVKSRFVLRGPREQTEGGKESTKEKTHPPNSGHAISSDNVQNDLDHDRDINTSEPNEGPIPEVTLINALETEAGLNLPKEIKGQYKKDLAFKMILDKPKILK